MSIRNSIKYLINYSASVKRIYVIQIKDATWQWQKICKDQANKKNEQNEIVTIFVMQFTNGKYKTNVQVKIKLYILSVTN